MFKRYGTTRKHELHDALIQHADDSAALYDSEAWHSHLAEDLIEAAVVYSSESFGHDNIKVLDVCCGTGAVAFAAKKVLGPATTIHGIDFSEKSIQIARRKAAGDLSFKFFTHSTTDILKIPELERESYDLVTIGSSFILLQDGLWTLQECVELLKPGGALVFDIPTPRSQLISDFMYRSLPEGQPVISRQWIAGDSSLRHLLSLTELKTLNIKETDSYNTVIYKFGDCSHFFDKTITDPIYQGDELKQDQLTDAKSEFIALIRDNTGKDGLIKDEYKFYIGVAAKKSGNEPKTPTSPHNNFNIVYEKMAHFARH